MADEHGAGHFKKVLNRLGTVTDVTTAHNEPNRTWRLLRLPVRVH
jgi:hypothetical protein